MRVVKIKSIKNIPINVLIGASTFRKNIFISDSLVSFWDDRFKDSDFFNKTYGQFITSYFISTLKNHNGGLILDGSIPNWSIDKSNMDIVLKEIEIFLNDPDEMEYYPTKDEILMYGV